MYLLRCAVLFVLAVSLRAEQCTTPNNEPAECVELFSCPVFLQGLASQKNTTAEFVAKSNCGGTNANPKVCCGSTSDFQEIKLPKDQLLPSRKVCGFQHSDDYYRPTNAVTITEFPWLARIKYKKRDHQVLSFECSGSLINTRYVLTLARCLRSHNGLIPEAVRLGEYDSTSDKDCVDEDPLVSECSEPVQDVGVEEIVLHPNYNIRNRTNDIGLLRLNRTILYSDYVRPICLPLEGSTVATVGDTLLSSGWGAFSTPQAGEVPIKKKIFSSLITNEECTKAYADLVGFSATDGHICTKGFSNNTDFPCNGDSGGPVMVEYKLQWFLVGSISFSANLICSASVRYPEVHTNVAHYIDWIQETIKP